MLFNNSRKTHKRRGSPVKEVLIAEDAYENPVFLDNVIERTTKQNGYVAKTHMCESVKEEPTRAVIQIPIKEPTSVIPVPTKKGPPPIPEPVKKVPPPVPVQLEHVPEPVKKVPPPIPVQLKDAPVCVEKTTPAPVRLEAKRGPTTVVKRPYRIIKIDL